MKIIIIVAVLVLALFALAAPVSAGQGGVGPCKGGAPEALPWFGFDVEPSAEFGQTIKLLATGPDTRATVAAIHAGFCASNS